MENSLLLSHLPETYWRKDTLEFVRALPEAPTLSQLAEELGRRGVSPREVWTDLTSARERAEATSKLLPRLRIHSVDYWSIHYPHSLRVIDTPPWNIFFIGQIPSVVPTLAIVGTRKPNIYGMDVVGTIVPQLQTRPLQIVSGLAYGIDSLAHGYACETSIPNFAVMACGLDRIYPENHLELARRILESGGGLISEYPPGTLPLRRYFPFRNRIISGLADVVWIVQGAGRSGSLHTARHALEQAKTVVTTPGDIFNELSELPHRLLLEGAHPILGADDLDLLLNKPSASVSH